MPTPWHKGRAQNNAVRLSPSSTAFTLPLSWFPYWSMSPHAPNPCWMWGLLFHLQRWGEQRWRKRPVFQALASFLFPEAQPPNTSWEEQDPGRAPVLSHAWNQDLQVSARVRSRRHKACYFSKKSSAAELLPSIAGCCKDRKVLSASGGRASPAASDWQIWFCPRATVSI